MNDNDKTESDHAYDRGYHEGKRRMALVQLMDALRELGTSQKGDDPRIDLAHLTREREETRAALRQLCHVYGDNDWHDNLNLADVVQKHLHQQLDEAQGD